MKLSDIIEETDDKMEKLADAQHEIWSHWMKYLFTKGEVLKDGRFAIDKEQVTRWKKQMNTPYSKLSEPEQESDRKVVRQFVHKQS